MTKAPFRYWRDPKPASRPDLGDMSSPKFSEDGEHIAAILRQMPAGFPVLATERFRAVA